MANLLFEPTPRHRQAFVRHRRVLLKVNVKLSLDINGGNTTGQRICA